MGSTVCWPPLATVRHHETPLYKVPSRSLAVGIAAVLLVALILADADVSRDATTERAAPVQMVGTFTGTYENDVPVYRLPPIQVTASRKAK